MPSYSRHCSKPQAPPDSPWGPEGLHDHHLSQHPFTDPRCEPYRHSGGDDGLAEGARHTF